MFKINFYLYVILEYFEFFCKLKDSKEGGNELLHSRERYRKGGAKTKIETSLKCCVISAWTIPVQWFFISFLKKK